MCVCSLCVFSSVIRAALLNMFPLTCCMCLCVFCHRSRAVWHISKACACMDLCLYRRLCGWMCVCVCSLVAQPASQQALGLLTAPPLPVNHKNSSMCEWRVAVGTLPREQKAVWGFVCVRLCVHTCISVYACLSRCVYLSHVVIMETDLESALLLLILHCSLSTNH